MSWLGSLVPRSPWVWGSLAVAAGALAVGVKTNRKVAFAFHFFMFGQVLTLLAFILFPLVRLLGIYRGPPNETISQLWVNFACRYFRCRFEQIGETPLYKERCMYLCPHRSWSDFFVHRKIVDGRGSNLSRWMVVAAFPLFWVVTSFDRSVFWFNRSFLPERSSRPMGGQKARGNSSQFNEWLMAKLEWSYLPSVINYPEGTRNPKSTPLPLKRGAVYFAYAYKIPVQIVMSKGNDDIVNERGFRMGFDKKIVYKYDDVIRAEDFATREEYFDHIDERFRTLFAELYQ